MYLGNAVEVAWIGFVVSALVITVAVLGWRRGALHRLRRALGSGLRPWHLTGGFVGAALVTAQAASVPLLGVALFSVLIVFGQTSSSLAVDRWGLVPGGTRRITAARIVGAVLLMAGVLLATAARMSQAQFAVVWLVLVVLAGAALPLQQAFNATVAGATDSPLLAAWVNFMVGALALTVVVMVRQIGGVDLVPPPAPWIEPTFWAAGLLGVYGIVVAALVVPWLGVLVFGMVSIAGLMISGLVLDAVTGSVQVTPLLTAGVLLCVVAVIVGSGRPALQRNA